MNFASIIYGLFFLITLGLVWGVKTNSMRLVMVVVTSIFFYASWQIQYLPLMIGILFINFYLGRWMSNAIESDHNHSHSAVENWQWYRFLLLIVGVLSNICLLLGFKYTPFVLDILGNLYHRADLLNLGIEIKERVVVPLGISFFSFECIAYLIDIYRGAPSASSLLKFSAYKLFFPKLISGPITRYHSLSGQLLTLRPPHTDQVASGVWLIACGAFKKALLADNLGILVRLIFDNLHRAGSWDIQLATFAYGLQLYLDFSGYVDMARGSGLLLGLNLPENFQAPYFTTNIADFWRCWHITLGDWLRNYLYFPLGGSRHGLIRTSLNLCGVMIIAGVWHGAAWGFMIWGGLHGLALVCHRLTVGLSQQISRIGHWWETWTGKVMAWLLTQLVVFGSWIFFRLPDPKDSGWAISHLFFHSPDGQFDQKVYMETIGIDRTLVGLALVLLFTSMGLLNLARVNFKLDLHWSIKLLFSPLCFYLVWLFAPQGGLPYIYFDF